MSSSPAAAPQPPPVGTLCQEQPQRGSTAVPPGFPVPILPSLVPQAALPVWKALEREANVRLLYPFVGQRAEGEAFSGSLWPSASWVTA